VNPDTGEAETPAHPRAGTWRRDLDYKIEQYERRMDRERDVEDRIALMSPAEKDAALKAVYLAGQGERGELFAGVERGWGVKQDRDGSLETQPNMRSPMMRRLASGEPFGRPSWRRPW
jgi:hypothetical protein